MIWSWKHLGCDAARLRSHWCPCAPRLEQAGSWLAPAWAQCGCWDWRGAEVEIRTCSVPNMLLIWATEQCGCLSSSTPGCQLPRLALQRLPAGWSAAYVSVQLSAFLCISHSSSLNELMTHMSLWRIRSNFELWCCLCFYDGTRCTCVLKAKTAFFSSCITWKIPLMLSLSPHFPFFWIQQEHCKWDHLRALEVKGVNRWQCTSTQVHLLFSFPTYMAKYP